MNKQDFLNAMVLLEYKYLAEAEHKAAKIACAEKTEARWEPLPPEQNHIGKRIGRMISAGIAAAAVFAVTFIGIHQLQSEQGVAPQQRTDEYLPLEQVYAQADAALEQQYENLRMPESIALDQVDTLYTFTGKWDELFLDKSDEERAQEILTGVLKNVCGLTVQREEIQPVRYNGSLHYQYRSDDEAYVAGVGADFHLYLSDFTVAPSIYSAPPVKATFFRINSGEDLSAVYELSGGACSVAEALAFCDETAEMLSVYGHPEEKLRAKSVYIIQRQNGKYEYMFVYERLYQGIPLDCGGDYCISDGFSRATYWFFSMDAPDHFSEISSQWPNDYVSGSNIACADSFLTLESAAALLSEELEENKSYRVKSIDIQYVCLKVHEAGQILYPCNEYRPMWSFLLVEEPEDDQNRPRAVAQTYAVVDMLNGDVHVLDITSTMFFKQNRVPVQGIDKLSLID